MIETGKRLPSLPMLVRLAKALGTTSATLLAGEEAVSDRLEAAAKDASLSLLEVAELAEDRLDGRERDALAVVRHACNEIVDGER